MESELKCPVEHHYNLSASVSQDVDLDTAWTQTLLAINYFFFSVCTALLKCRLNIYHGTESKMSVCQNANIALDFYN